MATTFHSRSNSFPSTSHPMVNEVEDQLCRLKSSEATSTSAPSIIANLAGLRDLHQNINNMIEMSSVQQALFNKQGESWINEFLEESLSLVDLCGFSRDIMCMTKDSVQDLESSIRRNRGEDMNAYVASRKTILKKVNKCIKNLKSFNKNSRSVPLYKDDDDLKAIATILQETEALDLSILKSVLKVVSAEKEQSKQRSWSLFSKSSKVYSEVVEQEEDFSLNFDKSKAMQNTILKQLKASEKTIEEIEEGLESFFRSLVKTRVTLLNVLSN